MFRTSAIQQHRVELSGGNEVSQVFASGGFFKQDGIMLGTGFKRGNFRLNSDHKISKRFTFGQTLYLSYGDQNNEQNSGGNCHA